MRLILTKEKTSHLNFACIINPMETVLMDNEHSAEELLNVFVCCTETVDICWEIHSEV